MTLNKLPKGFKFKEAYPPNRYYIVINCENLFDNGEYIKKSINLIEDNKEWWMRIFYIIPRAVYVMDKEDVFRMLDNKMYLAFKY